MKKLGLILVMFLVGLNCSTPKEENSSKPIWITNFSQVDKKAAIKYAKARGFSKITQGVPKSGKYSEFSLSQWGLFGLYGEK